MFETPKSTPIQKIEEEVFSKQNVKLYIKREDLIHPLISGNKWRKLKYNFLEAAKLRHQRILTLGGAYSNHIAAVAAAGKEYGFSTVGLIRGEEYYPLNPTLSLAKASGMKLIYVSRIHYAQILTSNLLTELKGQIGDFYFLPEGGTNNLAIKGCQEILDNVEVDYNYVACAVGTGGTIAGLASVQSECSVIGFSVLKGDSFLEPIVKNLVGKSTTLWKINGDYNFGGYAKFDSNLIGFINQFYLKHNIELDPIYTGKMMFGIYDLINKGFFPRSASILAIHTGGLQGKKGFNERFRNILI